MTRFSLSILIFFLTMNNVYSQQKPLDHDVYDFWKRPKQDAISDNGQWFLSVVKPDNGDGQAQFINLEADEKFIVQRADSVRFNKSASFAVFKVRAKLDSVKRAKKDKIKKKDKKFPQDSLAFIDLTDGKVSIKEPVKSYKMPKENGRWLAWLAKFKAESADSSAAASDSSKEEKKKDGEKEKPKKKDEKKKAEGANLVLLDFENHTEQTFENVTEYAFSKTGSFLAFATANKDSTADGLSVMNLKNLKVTQLFQKPGIYKNLTWDEQGKQLTFVSNADSFLTKQQSYALYYWKEKQKTARKIVDEKSKDLTKGWWVSEHAKLKFSDNGKRIIFGTAPRPEPEKEDESLDELPGLDVWHWKDPYVQPMQLKKLKDEKKRSYKAIYKLTQNKMIQLATLEIPEVQISQKGDGGIALGLSHLPYRQEISWDYPEYYDGYVISVHSGKPKKVLEKIQYKTRISPQGKYLFWWDRDLLTWNSFNTESQERINLCKHLSVPVFDEKHDYPYKADPYGFAGWTENDASLVFYDRFDLWEVNPEKWKKPVNITKGFGHENKLRFRYVKLDPEEEFLPNEMLLSAFHDQTKEAGYYSINRKNKSNPARKIFMPKRFAHLRKAKDNKRVIFTREDFKEFPDYWTSDLSFANPQKITDLNPQQKDYLWGSAEQVEWNSLNGKKLQGILIKPANFDPSVNYPMLVYFYDKSSDNLYRHWMPEPHRSIINFSFYASRGYVVFIPDIIYKDGYPGESALNAILPGVNFVVEQGFVDEKNIGVQGHSWGGYQIAYLVTRTNMFKAAEAGAPVANMTSAYGGIRWGTGKSRMFQYEKTQSRIGGTLWEYPMRYIDNSPLFRVAQIETPLLIMHNDQDGHVPWYQGIELFTAMRRLGKPSWMITYNKEPHWPTKFVNKKDWAIRLQQYFDHFLKGAPAPVWIKEGVPAIKKGKITGTEQVVE